MDSSRKLSYAIRKSPIFRVFILVTFVALIIGAIFLISFRTKAVPEIESIVPPVGAPGDVVIINGKNFGEVRDMSYVEIAGSKLTASSYISWNDNKITIVLPANVQDGLVFVGTKDLRSKPSLFTNEVDIPVPVVTTRQISKPIISKLSSEKFSVGDLIVIEGNNFGDVKGQTKLLFTIDYNRKIQEAEFKNIMILTENMVDAGNDPFNIVSWSNSEIKAYVPDGVSSGVIVVDNGTEKSDPAYYTLNQNVGSKSYITRRIYLTQYTADVAEIVTNEPSTITLRCPVPATNASQPNVELTETSPQPVLLNYQNDIIHQITKNKSSMPKNIFSQTFVIPVYEIRSTVNPEKIVSYNYKDTNPELLEIALATDELVPTDDEEIVKLSQKIIGKEKNPYRKAKLIYDYMCDNFKIQEKNAKNDSEPLNLLKKNRGDAYDFSVIYTALLRASGVPAFTDGGILVCQDMMTQAHWWAEFYLEDFGWVPVDVALGAGLEYKKWPDTEDQNDKAYYFGNLDSHHVQFSRGWNQLKPFSQDNKIVQQPRSYALQSIWEEASSNTVKYSSYWSLPVVRGIY